MDPFIQQLNIAYDTIILHSGHLLGNTGSLDRGMIEFLSNTDDTVIDVFFIGLLTGVLLALFIGWILPSVSFYRNIKRIAFQHNKSIKETEEIIGTYLRSVNGKNQRYPVTIKKRIDPKYISLSANASHFGEIQLDGSWIRVFMRMEENDDPIVRKCLTEVIGHELAHRKGDLPFMEVWKILKPKEKLSFYRYFKLANWVKEVHHDYAGFSFADISSLTEMMEIIDLKQSHQSIDKENISHPDWAYRKDRLKIGAFTKDMIGSISKDIGCSSDNVIEKLSQHYGDVQLAFSKEDAHQ